MGCSSGSLAKAGQYEPSGPVLAYLMAGTHTHTQAGVSYRSACLEGYLLCCSLYSDMRYAQPMCLMHTATCFVCGMLLFGGSFCTIVSFIKDSIDSVS